MDSDIQFGEVEEVRPQRLRRPDRDRHFAVCRYGAAAESDLPIFVDMDVLADIEAHARSDPSVELGGVVLGGQFEDEEGNPFVVVLDSLRAQHYESGSGHFKFTHDTWSEITRQRDEFSDDLQMVGWYHTHPNWGVFLSGMDRFICDHFFNRPLDVALVVDPVRGDRGWFYWDRERKESLPRAEGFRVIASRFRERELVDYVERLEEYGAMRPRPAPEVSPVGADAQIRQQIVHTIRPQLGWVGAAIVAMLVLQFFATVLMALRFEAGARDVPEDRLAQLKRREDRLAAREALFEKVLGRIRAGPDGKVDLAALVKDYQALRDEVESLRKTDLLLVELSKRFKQVSEEREGLAARVGELEKSNAGLREKIDDIEALREKEAKASADEIERLERRLAKATRRKTKKPEPGSEDSASTATADLSSPPERENGGGPGAGAIALAAAGLLAVGAVVVWIVRARRRPLP